MTIFVRQKQSTMTKTARKIIIWTSVLLILALAAFCYIKFYYVFSEGTQTGELNKIAKTGYVFKTYEGVMILTGYGSKGGGGTVQSNEFKFSVDDEAVAQELLGSTGMRVTVHFKKYFGALPWRGYEKSIVDGIISVGQTDIPDDSAIPEEQIFL